MSVGTVPVESAAALGAGQAEVRRREFLNDLVRHKAFWVGVVILGFWILAAIFGSLVVKDPTAQSLLAINQAPSSAHWFGTDQLGRDMFARVITGSRDILIIAVLADVLGTVAGTILGLLMGYYRGVVDDVLGRIVEAFLALPLVIVGILGTIALGGASTGSLIVIIAIVFTPLIARTVRAAVLIERDLDYVSAAKLRGESSLYIMFNEILPNIVPPIVVEFTVRLSYAIFTIVALSFLGFGIQPPSSDWGLDISNNYGQLSAGYWWEVLFDALAIATLVIGVNMVSTSVESALEG
ncbi:MAG TPA: ABC transporter permease [Solirubrobacteraceae bacterium]|nr:ABC transporter permease [Solirubrobacteraceae bacterium]